MSENQKKILSRQIKADLAKDLEKVKKEGVISLTYVARPWGGCDIPCGEEGHIVLVSPTAPENKGKRDLISPNELEKEDYDEIVSLMEVIRTTANQVREQKKQAEEAELDQKLQSEKNMFFYDGLIDWADYDSYHRFFGWEKNQRFNLILEENHPSIANIFNQKGSSCGVKRGIFCLIKGTENMPFEKKPCGFLPWKLVKLSDKITITPVDNSPYIEMLQGRKSASEEYLEKIQKENSDKVEEIAATKKQIRECEQEIQEEKRWLAEHGNNLPTSPENKDNIPKSPLKELNDETLLHYFQKNGIKSICLSGDSRKLIIERSDNSTLVDVLTNFPELKGLEQYLENKPGKKVSRQELETKNNSDNTSHAKPQDNTWKIVCGIGGTLTIIVIIGLFLKRKNKTKKR